MVYEKKIEPLTRWEVYMCAFTLQMWVIFLKILPLSIWSSDCIDIILHGDISSTEDTRQVHECIKDHRSQMLGGCSVLLIGFPIIICHVYYMNRLFETIFSFLNIGMAHTMYIGSWLIIATIYCTIFPGLLIFISYYDWQFITEYEYIGYALQFQFLHFSLIVKDALVIPLGIVGIIPWFINLIVGLGFMRSTHYKFTEETRKEWTNNIIACGCCKDKCGRYTHCFVALVLLLIILFSSFGDVFDFEKEGFFSYSGDSQYLEIILWITWEIQFLTIFILGCKFDKQMALLMDAVRAHDDGDCDVCPPTHHSH